MIFSKFIKLCDHYHNPALEDFHHPPKRSLIYGGPFEKLRTLARINQVPHVVYAQYSKLTTVNILNNNVHICTLWDRIPRVIYFCKFSSKSRLRPPT